MTEMIHIVEKDCLMEKYILDKEDIGQEIDKCIVELPDKQ